MYVYCEPKDDPQPERESKKEREQKKLEQEAEPEALLYVPAVQSSARTDGTGATAAAATSASAGAAFGDCRVAVPTRQALATWTTNALNGTSTRRLGAGVWLIMLSRTSCTVVFSSSSLFIGETTKFSMGIVLAAPCTYRICEAH